MAQIAPQPTGPTRTARTPGDHDEQAAHLFGLLANRRRLEMIRLLADRELDVGQLAQQLGINQPNVSQHLARLRDAGLITSQRSSQPITNRLTTPLIVAICSLAGQLAAELDRHRTAETNTRTTATSSGSDPVVTHRHGPPV